MISSIDVFLAQSTKLTSWLSPIWILSIGVGLGFVLVLFGLLKIFLFSKVPFLNTIADRTGLRWVFGILLSLVYSALALGAFYILSGADNVLANNVDAVTNQRYSKLVESFTLFLILVIPFCIYLGFGAWYLISKKRAPETLTLFPAVARGDVHLLPVRLILRVLERLLSHLHVLPFHADIPVNGISASMS